MSTVLTADQSKLLSILTANNWRVTRDVAEDLVDQIALDGAYSDDEKLLMELIRDQEGVLWFSRGTEAFLSRLISNLPLRFQREKAHKGEGPRNARRCAPVQVGCEWLLWHVWRARP